MHVVLYVRFSEPHFLPSLQCSLLGINIGWSPPGASTKPTFLMPGGIEHAQTSGTKPAHVGLLGGAEQQCRGEKYKRCGKAQRTRTPFVLLCFFSLRSQGPPRSPAQVLHRAHGPNKRTYGQ